MNTYIVNFVNTPAFVESIAVMSNNIKSSGGMCSTLSSANNVVSFDSMYGTNTDNGQSILLVQSDTEYNEADLIDMLTNDMISPHTQVAIEGIYLADDVIVKPINKQAFLKYVKDVPVYTDSYPDFRRPTVDDDINLSTYMGCDQLTI